jgi:UDP-N-acetylglucosamine 2-epimerase
MRSQQKPNTKIKYTAILIDGTNLGVGEDTDKWVLVTHKKNKTTTKSFTKVSRLLRHINRKFDIIPVIFPLDVEITRKTSFDDTIHDVVVFSEV